MAILKLIMSTPPERRKPDGAGPSDGVSIEVKPGEAVKREAVAIYRRARDAGNINEKWLSLAPTDLGIVRNYKGEPAASEASLREAMEDL